MNDEPEYREAVRKFCDASLDFIKAMESAGENAFQVSTERTHGLDYNDPNRVFASVEVYIRKQSEIHQRDELRDLCVLLFDAVKHGNQVVDLPGIWNKAEEVLNRTDPEDKP